MLNFLKRVVSFIGWLILLVACGFATVFAMDALGFNPIQYLWVTVPGTLILTGITGGVLGALMGGKNAISAHRYTESEKFLRKPSPEELREKYIKPNLTAEYGADPSQIAYTTYDVFLYFAKTTVIGLVDWSADNGSIDQQSYNQALNAYQIALSNYEIAMQNYISRVSNNKSQDGMKNLLLAAAKPSKPKEPDPENYVSYGRQNGNFSESVTGEAMHLVGLSSTFEIDKYITAKTIGDIEGYYGPIASDVCDKYDLSRTFDANQKNQTVCLNDPLIHWGNHSYDERKTNIKIGRQTEDLSLINDYVRANIAEMLETQYGRMANIRYTLKDVHHKRAIVIIPAILLRYGSKLVIIDHVNSTKRIVVAP